MEALKKSYVKKDKKTGIICLVIGVLLLLFMFKDWLPIGSSLDLNYVSSVEQISEGRANIMVLDIFDYYMYYTEGYDSSDENAVAREYLVCCGMGLEDDEIEHPVFIPVYLSGKKNDKAMELLSAYYGENDDFDFEDVSNYLSLKGHIKPLDETEMEHLDGFLQEVAQYEEMSMDELSDYFSSYIFRPNHITFSDEEEYLSIFAIIGAILLLGSGFFFFIQGYFGNPLKDLDRYASTHQGIEAAMSKAQSLIDGCNPVYGMRADEEMFLYDDGRKLFVADAKDVIWAHEHIVTRKSYFVTVGRDYYVKVYTADGRTIMIQCKKDEAAQIFRQMAVMCPDIIFGYSDELGHAYKANRQGLIDEVARRRYERLNNIKTAENDQSTVDMSMNYDNEM